MQEAYHLPCSEYSYCCPNQGGTPSQVQIQTGGYPIPDPDPERGYPIPGPGPDSGYPHPALNREGYPIPGGW